MLTLFNYLAIFVMATLALLLWILPFFKPSLIVAKSAFCVGILLSFFSAWSAIKNKQAANLYIESLNRLTTIIDWEMSDVLLTINNDPKVIEDSRVRLKFKILSVENTTLPSGAGLEMDDVKRSYNYYEALDQYYLPEQIVYRLFFAFVEQDDLEIAGRVNESDEEAAGMGHLRYMAGQHLPSVSRFSEMTFELTSSPNASTEYQSLSDLENACIIGMVESDGIENFEPLSIDFSLSTNIGRRSFRFLFPPIVVDKSNVKTFLPQRFTGMCFPEGYFKFGS